MGKVLCIKCGKYHHAGSKILIAHREAYAHQKPTEEDWTQFISRKGKEPTLGMQRVDTAIEDMCRNKYPIGPMKKCVLSVDTFPHLYGVKVRFITYTSPDFHSYGWEEHYTWEEISKDHAVFLKPSCSYNSFSF